jgi:hypothetical protein
MSVIDRAKARYSKLGLLSVDVPEWAPEDAPEGAEKFKVYFTPLTLNERDKAGDGSVGMARLVIQKARDGAGKPMFKLEDIMDFRTSVEGNVVARIAKAILDSVPTVEDMEKN